MSFEENDMSEARCQTVNASKTEAWVLRNPIKCATQGMYDFEYDEKGEGFHHIQPDCDIRLNPVEQDQILSLIKIDYSVPAYYLCRQPPSVLLISVNDALIETVRISDEKRKTVVVAIRDSLSNNSGGGGVNIK
ncbi:MAG: hypothetical protein LBK69_02220 [Syntrophomonadaceae bacterium]|jgi:hypothetical protein|nr:hypothetical protein [Syntrophomonadaceae bacterium]